MHLRSDNDGLWRLDARDESRRATSRGRLPSERMQQIRERVELDAYRSADVVDEIARRILRSCDL